MPLAVLRGFAVIMLLEARGEIAVFEQADAFEDFGDGDCIAEQELGGTAHAQLLNQGDRGIAS